MTARRLSNRVLEKVKHEWEFFINHMESTTIKRTFDISTWNMYHFHNTYKSDDVEWTCSCLFYSSYHLPFFHLMHVAAKGHECQIIPGISVHTRWNTLEALDVKEELAAAA
ncbi:hypothetical protein PHMEG_0009446 [Phytophthora megakarya]|uniref:Uncharacterized protein n=1 Tax=Phytophthora megakarya TaxID=4795 RepID=A0A225WG75_9STRA|nr:hypothetical protein PHMEG_0009446 [Phytophthora megakarya]